jgi:hypothetical protein
MRAAVKTKAAQVGRLGVSVDFYADARVSGAALRGTATTTATA